MRATLGFLSVIVWAALTGCQSIPLGGTPIVGDSMTVGQWQSPSECYAGEYDGLSDTTCTACPAGSCTTPDGPPGGQMMQGPLMSTIAPPLPSASPPSMLGCAGATCDGRCGGRCRMALARMEANMANMQAQMQSYIANRPGVSRVRACAQQKCAGGPCGGTAGPEFGAVTYPYYTTRGPRDFLLADPPSIGP